MSKLIYFSCSSSNEIWLSCIRPLLRSLWRLRYPNHRLFFLQCLPPHDYFGYLQTNDNAVSHCAFSLFPICCKALGSVLSLACLFHRGCGDCGSVSVFPVYDDFWICLLIRDNNSPPNFECEVAFTKFLTAVILYFFFLLFYSFLEQRRWA